jgi:hypothetical protein
MVCWESKADAVGPDLVEEKKRKFFIYNMLRHYIGCGLQGDVSAVCLRVRHEVS